MNFMKLKKYVEYVIYKEILKKIDISVENVLVKNFIKFLDVSLQWFMIAP